MADYLYILHHPDYSPKGDKKHFERLVDGPFYDLAARIRDEIGIAYPCILTSPNKDVRKGADLLRNELGGSIEDIPLFLTTKECVESYMYHTETPQIVELLNLDRQDKSPNSTRRRYMDEVAALVTGEIPAWIEREKILPSVKRIAVPFSPISLFSMCPGGGSEITGVKVPVIFSIEDDPAAISPYLAALVNERLESSPVIIVGPPNFVKFYAEDLLGAMGVPRDNYWQMSKMFEERKHLGYRIMMPAEDPNTWLPQLIDKQ